MLLALIAAHPSVTSCSPYIPGTNKAPAIMQSKMVNENRRTTVMQAQHLFMVNDVQHAWTPTMMIVPRSA